MNRAYSSLIAIIVAVFNGKATLQQCIDSVAHDSAYQGKEIVPVKKLDTVAGQYLKNAHAPFLKIDTQGFEWQVLDGRPLQVDGVFYRNP